MKRLTVIYEVPDGYNVTRITGTGELNVVWCESMDALERLAEVEAENKRLRLHNMDLREVATEYGLVYRDDNDQLRFTDSGDLVGKEG